MNNLQIFNSPDFGQIRTIQQNGEPWFVGKDVAQALGYSQTAKAVREHVKDNHKGMSVLDTPGGKQETTIIDEAGLYSLVMRAKTDKAEAFQEWVTSEVLPAIRKHGGYLTADKIEQALTDPDTIEVSVPKLGLSLKPVPASPPVIRPAPTICGAGFTNRPLALKTTCLTPSKSTLQAVRRSFTQNLSCNDVLTAPIPKAVLIPIPL